MFRLVRNTPFSFKNEVFAGVSVAVFSVVQATVFSAIANIDFKFGLVSFVLANLVSFILNGRRGTIVANSNLILIILFPIVAKYGFEYVFWISILSSILQFSFGFFRFGKYIRMIPKSVILGAISGFSILILFDISDVFYINNYQRVLQFIEIKQLLFFVGFLCFAILYLIFVPKFFKFLPATLVLLLMSVVVKFIFPEITSVEDYASSLKTNEFSIINYTKFPWVPISFETIRIILVPAFLVALISIIQSLFLLSFTDRIMNNRGKSNKEMIAQGVINFISSLVGGVPVALSPSLTAINLNAGGKGKIAGLVAAFLVTTVFIFEGITSYIPLYLSLSIFIILVAKLFVRSSFFYFHKVKFSEAFILVAVASITVILGIFYAVVVGGILASAFFSWENAQRIRVRKRLDDNGVKYYEMYGPLFFASVNTFLSKFDFEDDANEFIFDFLESKVLDYEGAKVLISVIEQYAEKGKIVKIKYINSDMKRLLVKRNVNVEIIDDEEDPTYTMLIDELS